MSEIRILIGIPGSGKTTYARYLERFKRYVRISKDEIVRIPDRRGVEQRIRQTIEESVKSGKNVVVDGTYINRGKRKMLADFCKGLDAEIVFCLFNAKLKDCIKHNDSKEDFGKPTEEIVRKMHKDIENPTKKEGIRIEKINSDEWFSEHEEEVKLINEHDYERDIRNMIVAARFSNR